MNMPLFERMLRQLTPRKIWVAWSVIVIASIGWNVHNNYKNKAALALVEARTIVQHNIAYRRWNASYSGVYVRLSEISKPNPFIDLPDRDIITIHGEKLTMINPFQMTRQAYHLLEKQLKGSYLLNRSVSLDPLNPTNAPDEWERNALLSFETGAREFSELTEVNEKPYLRILTPYITEDGCLKCHGHQGYRRGDIRGGLSIAVPMEPYYQAAAKANWTITITHALIWLTGMIAVHLFFMGLDKYKNENKRLEEQIMQSQQMERLGHFAGAVAHDFNNMLASIMTFSHLLTEELDEEDEELRDYANHIGIACRLGKYLTANLLTFGKRQSMRPAKVNVNTVINGLSTILGSLIIREDIEFSLDLTDEEKNINADPHQLEQILINLCINARDAMPDGGRLRVATRLVSLESDLQGKIVTVPAGEYMNIVVEDTGVGIDNDKLETIFQPFYTTKTSRKGTGLGLAIIKSITTQHQAFIDVQSVLGAGATFSLYFHVV